MLFVFGIFMIELQVKVISPCECEELVGYPFNSRDLRKNEAFSGGTEIARTDTRFLKASRFRVC